MEVAGRSVVSSAAAAAGVARLTAGAVVTGTSSDAGARSSRMTLRALWTSYVAGDVSATRTRASALPSIDVSRSTVTSATGPVRATFAVASAASPLRRS